ncbi:MAG: hypothetical protein HPY73_00915 [Methanomassiliicoccales archaeon]|nr:MAG: hypothetical protein HPY73_00915 [Methanomassiliicoccales archaeon]
MKRNELIKGFKGREPFSSEGQDVRVCARDDVRVCARDDVRVCARDDVRVCARDDVRVCARMMCGSVPGMMCGSVPGMMCGSVPGMMLKSESVERENPTAGRAAPTIANMPIKMATEPSTASNIFGNFIIFTFHEFL